MKSKALLLMLGICSTALYGAEQVQGPMNAVWFYEQDNPFYPANKLHQGRQWEDAAIVYKKLLKSGFGNDYDKDMANVNRAACTWAAFRKASKGWSNFDTLIGIPQEKRIFQDMIDNSQELSKKRVLVRTDLVGIGDIFHFWEGANVLQKRTGCRVVVSVRDILKGTLLSAANAYNFELVSEKIDEQPKTDYTTHLIGLLGHLKLNPAQTAPECVILTAPKRAMVAVSQQIAPVLAQGKILMMVNIGDIRTATLIGGRQLPRDPQAHGRHLDSEPFRVLLRNHPDLVLIDCGTKDGRVIVDEDQKDQYMLIAPEEQAFDTSIALALLMNDIKEIIGAGGDTGVTNVFIRALTEAAQRRFALVIPNGSRDKGEYDMRMEGNGAYTQMISNCRVYKCNTPADQTAVIEKVYQDMVEDDDEITSSNDLHHWIR